MRTTNWQIFRFSLVYFNSRTSIFLIPIIVSGSGYQGWISILFGSAMSVVLLFFMIKAGKLKTGDSWIDFGSQFMGKWGHRVLVLLLLCWCVYYTSYDIENFVLFFGSNYMRGTPPLFIQLAIGIVIAYTAAKGVATIIYMADGVFLLLIATTFFSLYLFLPNANFQMLPAFIHYFDPGITIKDAVTVTSWFAEWVVLLFVAPELKINNNLLKKVLLAEFVLTVLVLAGWALTMLNFGPHLGKDVQYPYLDMVRSSSHDDILGNLDPILIGIWSASMFIHSSFMIYVASKCALYLTKQKGEKLMVPFLVFCSVLIAYLYSRSITRYYSDFSSSLVVILWLVAECIPVYYTMAAFIKSRINKPAS
ncbi:GerAB/ArcD/ProY family transporter [Paenibacillus sp. FSL R7-0331]|uniref:GerAB/ArcD/ProY family transporter n=1 Tax=Paenibacillus sp. FSL R7-0331 TaxID=1536773 RepID=UPI0004F63C9A|nr:GerAB/ArcD/ProY family transporter [Paenibacillus sp. FSL R7-0331]AIQ52630.1 hypothetical protein R70331_14640 [Paenibacillus sp. FSL R7-0331]